MKNKKSARPDATLADLGEDRVVAELSRNLPRDEDVVVGAGDDCAVLKIPGDDSMLQLFKTDVVVEGVHFLPETAPAAVGWKALCRAISDIGAMGGWPTSAVITLIVPEDRPMQWVTELYRGLKRAAKAYSVSIVGGETSRMPGGGPAVVNVSLLGLVDKDCCVLRSGGKPDDFLCVTGKLGGSQAGSHLNFTPRVVEGNWLAENFPITAMIDLSDGLAADLQRLAAASRTGFRLLSMLIPKKRGVTLDQALGDGEDYELLFTIPMGELGDLVEAWREAFPDLPLTTIGRLTERSAGDPPLSGGFDHFDRPSAKKR